MPTEVTGAAYRLLHIHATGPELDQGAYEPVTKEFVRAEINGLEARINERLGQQTIWMAGASTVGMGRAAGMGGLIGSG